jgi:MoaA/NifB/PqqE/SkfB family radical SAM enzyme
MKLLLNIYSRAFLRLLKSPPHFRVVSNYVKYFWARKMKLNLVSHTPTNVVIYTTKNCNLNCDFCFIGDDLNPANGKDFELTYEQYQEITKSDFFKNSLRVGLLGGEPFIAKDIFQILEDLNKRRKVVTVVTNSTLLVKEKLDKFYNNPPDILGLSLYETNRDDVSRVYKKMHKKSIVWIQTILEADRLEDIYDVLEYCKSIGCSNIRFSNYYPTYGHGMEKVIFNDDKNFISLKKKVTSKYGNILNIDWPAPVSRELKTKSCLQPISYVHVDNKGAIGACFMRPPNEERYGNIYDENSWNGPSHVKLRSHMNSVGSDCDSDCRYCENLSEDLYKI